MSAPKKNYRDLLKEKQKEKSARNTAFRAFIKQLIPLLSAVVLWFVITSIIHLPSIKDQVHDFFVSFTLYSAIAFGRLLFIPVGSNGFPNLTIDGYTMKVIMECTAYNFYIFVIALSLFSPVLWYKRLLTMIIFVAAIFVINNFRFYSMGFIGNKYPGLFDNIHDYIWNVLFGLLVFLIWLWRYKKYLPNANPANQEKVA